MRLDHNPCPFQHWEEKRKLLLPGACGMDSSGAHGGLFCIGFNYAIGQGGVA